MADPAARPDADGEWFELYNPGPRPVSLRGWTIASRGDAGYRVTGATTIDAGGWLVLGRVRGSRNGGIPVGLAYGSAITLGNDADWLAVHDASGRTVDSVAWNGRVPTGAARILRRPDAPHADLLGDAWGTSQAQLALGDRGTPGAANDGSGMSTSAPAPASTPVARAAPSTAAAPSSGSAGPASELVVRLLDVGQGDATLITNGGSTVLIDGGPDAARLGVLLDSLGLDGTTIDVVIATHTHIDHYNGLRELFRTRRHIAVRYFYENQDPYPNVTLAKLRDSINARVIRGEMLYRDTDDPCGDGRPVCSITMRGGATLRLLRPRPPREPRPNPNDRSAIVKLVGPDSASFTMWLAGDAERDEISWMSEAGYAMAPGMAARVLKADHHGSCNGITAAYLDRVRPEVVLMSVGAVNDYGHVHEQTKQLLSSRRTPWYRTDQNGTITVRSPGTPGGGYSVSVVRGGPDESGRSDKWSTQGECRS